MTDADQGLIFGYILKDHGGATRIGWDALRKWKPEEGFLWIHIDYRSIEANAWLATASGLDEVTRQALTEEETRPRVVRAGEGLLLILRGVNFNPGADPEDMVAVRIWLEEGRMITMRHRKVMAVDDVRWRVEEGKGPAEAGDFLVAISERLTDRMGDIVTEIDDEVDSLEDQVLTSDSRELRPRLAQIRRQTIAMRRYIAPQRDILTRLLSERISWLSDVQRLRLRETAERTARYVDDLDSARDRAAITQEELNNHLSEQMNKTMYVLSIVAAIFLPLGLLTGLLGINVGGIPGTESKWAFSLVSVFLLVVAIVELWIFKRMKWL